MFTLSTIMDVIATDIPALMVGADKLHVVLATYNEVFGYKDGAVETGKDGLTISIQSGHLSYSQLVLPSLLSGHFELMRLGSKMMDTEGREAQSKLESTFTIEGQPGDMFLVIIYAGLSAFDEAIEMARKAKRNNPTAKVIVVTCDCELRKKTYTLRPMLDSREIDSVVVDRECGGRGAMKTILEGVINMWPSKLAT